MPATGEEEPSEATPIPDTPQPITKDTTGDLGSVVEFPGTPVFGRPRDNNLSLQLTDLVGREREIKEVENLLSEHRLLTLTRPGGSSSTRFAGFALLGALSAFVGLSVAVDMGTSFTAMSIIVVNAAEER